MQNLEPSFIDMIFSQAVLEHVRSNGFQHFVFECYRVLKDSGVCSHCIDLKDHIGGGLNNLRIKRFIWESNFFSTSGFYTNRIRFKKILSSFSYARFIYKDINVKRWDVLPIQRQDLDAEFSIMDDDELLISEFDILLYKKTY